MSRWRSWMRAVCSALSSIVSSKQRVAFSWLTIVRRRGLDEGGAGLDRELLVFMLPVCGSLIGAGRMSFLRLWSTRTE